MDGEFSGRRVTVMGLGSFGGGLGAVRFLVERRARVLVTDLRSQGGLQESLRELADLPSIEYQLGEHRTQDFVETDLLVVNPAVPPRNEYLQVARNAGVPLATEMSLFWTHNRGRVIAVTGSNGKSTTTALTHSLLASSGRKCWLGGNIGKSLLPSVEQISAEDWVVLELSSFQLEWLNLIQARPEISIVTNFSPNHLDWHETLDAYRSAKQSLLRWQQPTDWAIVNADDSDVLSWPTNAQVIGFGTRADQLHHSRLNGSQISLRTQREDWQLDLATCFKLAGQHNRMNAAAAIAAASAAGVSRDDIMRGLAQFESLPHRLQLVAEGHGRAFYDDSIATTPESAICGLNSFDRPIVLLAGGYDKQVDLSEFARAITRQTKAVALLGQTASALAQVIAETAADKKPNVLVATSFAEAFEWSIRQSAAGDVVLLSPGCASYDWFRNFIDRGQQFADRARAWCGQDLAE